MTAYGVTDSVSVGNLPLLSGALVVTGSITVGSVTFSGSIGAVAVTNLPAVQAVVPQPVTGSQFCPLSSGSVGALPGVVKAAPGTLYRVFTNNRNAAARYLQLFNSTTGPSGVPLASFQVPGQVGAANPTNAPVVDFGPWGIFFSVGISIGVSTSPTSYAAATSTETDSFVMWV